MRCLLVDDDLQFTKLVIAALCEEIPQLNNNIDHILTEKALQKRLAAPEYFDYDTVILDIMVRWTDLNDTEKAGVAPGDSGYFRAGIRCLANIRSVEQGADIPILIHSARDRSDIETLIQEAGLNLDNVSTFPKDGNFEPLILALKKLIPGGSSGGSRKRHQHRA